MSTLQDIFFDEKACLQFLLNTEILKQVESCSACRNPELKDKTVNHLTYFEDPVTQVHKNTIEGTWNAIKRRISIRRRNKEDLNTNLMEFVWRRQNNRNLWEGLLRALKNDRISRDE